MLKVQLKGMMNMVWVTAVRKPQCWAIKQPCSSWWSSGSARHCHNLNRRRTFNSCFPPMSLWALLPRVNNMFICCSADSFSAKASLPWWKCLKVRDYNCWEGCLTPVIAGIVWMLQPQFLQQLTVFMGHHLVYVPCTHCQDNGAERLWNTGQRLLHFLCLRLQICSEKCYPSFLRKYPKLFLLLCIPPRVLSVTAHCKACICLPAGAFVSHEWTLLRLRNRVFTVNGKCL